MTPTDRSELVRIDDTGTVHAIGRKASERLRERRGEYRLLPAPRHVLFMRYVGEDGQRDEGDGAVVRLAGEVIGPGAICDIVTFAAQAGWRGELVVQDGDRTRTILFDSGYVVGATSDAPGERVGDVMYKLGALTQEQVDAVMARTDAGRRFGEAAVDLGYLTSERVFTLMCKQTEEIVHRTLLVSDGSFFFLDGYDETQLTHRHHVSAAAVLMEGVRRMDELKYFRERIPTDSHVPVRLATRAEIPEALTNVWNAIDDKRSVAELGRLCELDEFEVTHALFQLVQSGHVEIEPPLPTRPEAVVAIFNAIARAVFEAAGRHGPTEALQNHLASFAVGVGVYHALFAGGGPLPDGTLSEPVVAANAVRLAGDEATTQLSQWLHEYACFALFDASSVMPKKEATDLALRVGEWLARLAPKAALSTRA